MQNTKQKSGTKQKLTIAAIFGAMGPGLLAALSGNDAGGIATYSSAGASYGYKMLWMLPVMTVLLIVTQETAARCGCVTGKGLASLIRERFGVRKSVLAMAALLIANTAVTISEFAGIASGLALFGVPASISVPLVALLVWMLTMSGSFQRIEKILLLVSCVFVTYIVAAFMAGPNWGEVAVDLVVPNIQNDPSYVSLVVATIGTTIAPWMIFLAQNNVVDKNAGEDDIVLQRIDTVSGSLAADVIAGFIIITTGTVLFPAGIQISDAADAARALEPIAGQWSTVLFASGLVAAAYYPPVEPDRLSVNLRAEAEALMHSRTYQEEVAEAIFNRRTHSVEQALKVAQQHNISRSETDVPADQLPDSELFLLGRPMLQARLENLQAVGPEYDLDYDQNRAMLSTLNVGPTLDPRFQTYRYLRTPEEPVKRDSPRRVFLMVMWGIVGALIGAGVALSRRRVQ